MNKSESLVIARLSSSGGDSEVANRCSPLLQRVRDVLTLLLVCAFNTYFPRIPHLALPILGETA
jgi:hypothetical protein